MCSDVYGPLLSVLRIFHGVSGSWPWSLLLLLLALAVESTVLLILGIAYGLKLLAPRREEEERIEARRPLFPPGEYERQTEALAKASRGGPWQVASIVFLFLATKGIYLYTYIGLFLILRYAPDLRGTPLLWIPDLSQPDPKYVISILLVLVVVLGLVRRLGRGTAKAKQKCQFGVKPIKTS